MKKDAQPYMGSVKVGPKGQIVIPKEARDMFGIEPGQSLMLFAHPEKGIGIQQQSVLLEMATAIFEGKGQQVDMGEKPENLEMFANAIVNTVEKEKNK